MEGSRRGPAGPEIDRPTSEGRAGEGVLLYGGGAAVGSGRPRRLGLSELERVGEATCTGVASSDEGDRRCGLLLRGGVLGAFCRRGDDDRERPGGDFGLGSWASGFSAGASNPGGGTDELRFGRGCLNVVAVPAVETLSCEEGRECDGTCRPGVLCFIDFFRCIIDLRLLASRRGESG